MRPFSKRKSENLKKLLRNTLARFISLSNCAVNHIKILADALHAFVKVPADFLTRCGKRLAVGFLPRGKGAAPLGGGTVCRHIFKRDNLHLCGAKSLCKRSVSSSKFSGRTVSAILDSILLQKSMTTPPGNTLHNHYTIRQNELPPFLL